MADTIEGRNPVIEALKADRPLNKILLAKNLERHSVIAEIIHLAGARGVPVEWVDRQAIDRQSRGVNQGVIAWASAKEYVDLDELLAIPGAKKEAPLFVLLDGVEDPHNLGAVIRTADATGVHGVIIREKRSVGLTPVVEKSSAGAVEYVPVARVTNISRTIDALKERNIWVAGIDQSGGTLYTAIDFKGPAAIVIGGEGEGLSELVKKHCDYLACIPMKGKINSLNASVAAAVVMYEAVRQRSPEGQSLKNRKQ